MKKAILKITGTILLSLVVLSGVSFKCANANELTPQKRLFLVTAYYSPLPDQTFYIKGSYEADRLLNGRGTNGADGTEVYVGMVAAPKNYPFGTKIQIPGLGIGAVHDRGGAILNHHDYDRIDVWMGKGEAGLARALRWGKRLVSGEIVAGDRAENINFDWIETDIPKYILNRETRDVKKLEFGQVSVEELQQSLRQFGYYHAEVNGQMDKETRAAILSFQLDYEIIASPFEEGAGTFGPRTRAMLQEKLKNFNAEIEAEKRYLREHSTKLEAGLGKSSSGDAVKTLQRVLLALGYYQGHLTGLYDQSTIASVFEFQKKYQIVRAEGERGAGYFGPKTHQTLVAAAKQRVKEIAELPQEKQLLIPANQKWPALKDPSLKGDLAGADMMVHRLNFGLFASGKDLRLAQKKGTGVN